jgi:hypothetical protein
MRSGMQIMMIKNTSRIDRNTINYDKCLWWWSCYKYQRSWSALAAQNLIPVGSNFIKY